MSIQYYPGRRGFRWGKNVNGIWVELDLMEQRIANSKHGVTEHLNRMKEVRRG